MTIDPLSHLSTEGTDHSSSLKMRYKPCHGVKNHPLQCLPNSMLKNGDHHLSSSLGANTHAGQWSRPHLALYSNNKAVLNQSLLRWNTHTWALKTPTFAR